MSNADIFNLMKICNLCSFFYNLWYY